MSREWTTTDDVEALADLFDRWERGEDGANETDAWQNRLARALLASSWLADVRREERERADEYRERMLNARMERDKLAALLAEERERLLEPFTSLASPENTAKLRLIGARGQKRHPDTRAMFEALADALDDLIVREARGGAR